MNTMLMLHATARPDCVAELETAVEKMFAAIEAARPEGLHYSSVRSSDGVTFVAMLALDEGVENPLPAIPEFQDFQAGLGAWLVAPPVPDQMTVVGSYGMFGG